METTAAFLGAEIAALRASLAAEPDGAGGTLLDVNHYRRALTAIEIDLVAFLALSERFADGGAPGEPIARLLLAAEAARLRLLSATLAMEAAGGSASPDQTALGHNRRVAQPHAEAVVARYAAAIGSEAAARNALLYHAGRLLGIDADPVGD